MQRKSVHYHQERGHSEFLPPVVAAPETDAGVSVEQKLKEQYEFFRGEFLSTALSLGIPVPLDITEDKSKLIQKFLLTNGPKYVYQIVQSNKDHLQLQRTGLTLLITVIIFLRRMLPETLADDRLYGKTNSWSAEPRAVNLEQQWAASQLVKVCDVMNVSTLVVMFISTPNALVQELILSLLSNLLVSSDDAIVQMLQVPSAFSSKHGGALSALSLGNSNTAGENAPRPTLKRWASRLSSAGDANNNNSSAPKPFNHSNSMSSTAWNNAFNNGGNNNGASRVSFVASGRGGSRQIETQMSSSLSLASANDDAALARTASGNNANSDELNTCLSYLLSVVLMQKNRHLLLAGCADVILAMTHHGSAQLSEVIARTPTCPVPLLATGNSDNGRKRSRGTGSAASSLKQLMGGAAANTLPINPLGSRVIDWAGIRLLLKFLQRYHAMFHGKNQSSSSNSEAGGEEDDVEKDLLATPKVRAEYHHAHNRALLAACVLISSSPEVAHYVYSLPGAHQLLIRASEVFNAEKSDSYTASLQRASSSTTTMRMMNAHNHMGGSQSLSSAERDSLTLEDLHSDLPHAIINALNTLQIEKQNELRLEREKERELERQKEREREREAMHAQALLRPKSSSSPMTIERGQESFTKSGRNSTSRQKSRERGKQRLNPIDFSGQGLPTMSAPVIHNQSERIDLAPHYSMEFRSRYSIETESGRLYVQNKINDIMRSRGPVSPLQFHAAKTIQRTQQTPLHAQVSQDSLLNSSLEAIEKNAKQSIMQQTEVPPTSAESLYIDNPSQLFQSTTTASTAQQGNNATSSSLADAPIPFKSSMISPNAHGLSAYRDFFCTVPRSPPLPKRIEAKDAIIPGEDLKRIRNKFKLLAEDAVEKTKQHGNGVMINGKSTVSIEERARKNLLPPRTHNPWEEQPNKENEKLVDAVSSKGSLQKSSLEPLSFLDQLFEGSEGDSNNGTAVAERMLPFSDPNRPPAGEDEDKTPAWYQNQNRFDPQAYGIKLDTIDFEEQNLFDNFKSIFDYAEAIPPPDYDSKKKTVKSKVYQDPNETANNQVVRFAQEVQQSNDMILG